MEQSRNIYLDNQIEPIEDLQNKIALWLEASHYYYNTDETLMSDEEFDSLTEYLVQHGVNLDEIGAPTTASVKVKHRLPMRSLGKVKVKKTIDGEEFTESIKSKIAEKLKRYGDISSDTKLLGSWKYDGCAVDIEYKNGFAIDAITRGNGSEGESIYQKIKHIIPMKLYCEGVAFTGSIRGEVLMKKSIFAEKYAEKYANPRNLVSGILGDENLDDERKFDLSLKLYSVNGLRSTKSLGSIETDKIECFTSFDTLYFDELKNYYYTKQENRSLQEFPTDGIVIQFADENVSDEFKGNSHEPYHMIAIKFPPKRAKTKIISVELNLRKSGEFIPNLRLEPTFIDGSTVRACNGYNWGYLIAHGLFPGAEIEIGKNGDIIPYVQSVINPVDAKFQIEEYSSGNMELFVGDSDKLPDNAFVEGVHLYSRNADSPKIRKERFISQCYALEFKGFGWSTFNSLYDLVDGDFVELFNPLNLVNEMLAPYISGEKTRRKWISCMNNFKENATLYWFIGALRVPGCSWAHAKQFARKASGLEYSFSGLNRSVIEYCLNGPGYKEIGMAIMKFKEYGGKLAPERDENRVAEATYEMTGNPNVPGYKTKADIVKQLNKWDHTSLKKGTTYLITDSKSSSTNKMSKARSLGITILTYEEALILHKTGKL